MINKQPKRPLCSDCGLLPARPNGISVKGYQLWHKLCNSCARKKYQPQIVKDNKCSSCGFVAEHSCQLCLVSGQTICQNCNSLRIQHQRHPPELTVDATVDLANITI